MHGIRRSSTFEKAPRRHRRTRNHSSTSGPMLPKLAHTSHQAPKPAPASRCLLYLTSDHGAKPRCASKGRRPADFLEEPFISVGGPLSPCETQNGAWGAELSGSMDMQDCDGRSTVRSHGMPGHRIRNLQISNSTCRDQLLQLFRAPKREILDRFSNASTEENVMDIGRPPLSVHQ